MDLCKLEDYKTFSIGHRESESCLKDGLWIFYRRKHFIKCLSNNEAILYAQNKKCKCNEDNIKW